MIMRHGRDIRTGFARQIRASWECAEGYLALSPHCSYVRPQGGFYATLRLNRIDEERAAEAILREKHLLVHPGYFYDMSPDHLVLSFVQEPEVLRDSLPGIMETLNGLAGRTEAHK